MPMNDYWNPDAYRERLRQTIGARGGPALGAPGQVPVIAQQEPPQPTGAGPSITDTTGVVGQQFGKPARGAALAPAQPRPSPQPQPAVQQQVAPPTQKAKVPTGPPGWKPDVDESALAKAKKFPDVMDAIPKAQQGEYMDWWEKQYGSINAKYDKIQQEIGERPDPRRKLSRRDKFDLLMEFGLNLMRASQPDASGDDTAGALSSAFGETVRGQQDTRAAEQQNYDQRLALSQAGRASELKELGNRGAALKSASDIDENNSQIAERQGRPNEVADVYDTTEGKVSRTRGGALTVLKSPDTGKPLRADPRIGARGGALQDTRPAEEKRYDHLISLGLPKELAMRVAYKQSSGDPRKDYKDVFKTALSSNFGNEKRAKEIAQSYIDLTYGAGAELDQRDQPMLPAGQTPAGNNDPLGIRGQ